MSTEPLQQASLADYFKAIPQYVLPHQLLSGVMHRLTRSRSKWFKNWLIGFVVKNYHVDMRDAQEENPLSYETFNHFFTRALKPSARPLCEGETNVACPVDGTVSQAGKIEHGKIFQAKGRSYTLLELLGGDKSLCEPFKDGSFATIYLSPRDYHRIHTPLAGELKHMVHVPGRLFSVSPATTRAVPSLFARNERVVSIFETCYGPMAVILVGAIFVSSMETVWAGTITPPYGSRVVTTNYAPGSQTLARGDELGRFNMGSTVIVLFGQNKVEWVKNILPGGSVQMGQHLAKGI
ncbi:MAG: archaetidylserine decarboxylase [Gammaproteobacteria bacterium]|nr:archaetidylserine decarboxylase [Gammaproteobacteria bacterium]